MSCNECECCINSSAQSKVDHSHSNQNCQDQDYFENMWYDWWWNYQNIVYQGGRNNVANNYATQCVTCVEEQRLRELRVKSLTNKQTYTCHGSISPFATCEMNCERVDRHGNDRLQDIAETCGYEDSEHVEEYEMELNNDFKKFLEQSARHKEERKKQKEADLAKAQKDDYIEVNEIALEATTVAPTQQQGVLRTQEMKELYGRSAHDIESLETSLQLQFNMNVDMRHPVFWPSIPLKF